MLARGFTPRRADTEVVNQPVAVFGEPDGLQPAGLDQLANGRGDRWAARPPG